MLFNAINPPSSNIKTLLEPNDISVLPQHRLKILQTNLIPAICFYNGSFAPIHAGHISVLREAKQFIDNLQTHELLAAYISPSHSGYIAKKLCPDEFIGTGHRLAMINLAIEDLNWVMVDLYETFQSRSSPLGTVMEAFMKRARSQLPDGARIDVFWLKGEDSLCYQPSEKLLKLGFQSLYVLNRGWSDNLTDRNEESISGLCRHEKRWQELRASSSFPGRFHLIKVPVLNLSSTTIRACSRNPSVTLEQLQLCTQLDSVATYILQHHLWCTREDALPVKVSSMPVFSHRIDDLTPELLSHMLSEWSGILVQAISFMTKRIGDGRGWGGPLHRIYNIRYSSAPNDSLLQSVVLKLSTGIWNGRVASVEPDFYMNLAPRISHVEVPRCYYTARYSNASDETLMLLEDLSLSCEILGQKQWLSDETLFTLVATIATLHAEFFEHPLLLNKAFTWLPSLNSILAYYQTKYTYEMTNKNYIKLLQSKVSPKAYAYAMALRAHIPHLFDTLSNERYSLSHGDFWINNVLVRRDQSHRLVLLDWQTCCRANGLLDVVQLLRFLGSNRARSLESHVLKLYHQVLMKYGISNYDASEIREDYYSLALPFMFVFFVCWNVTKGSKLEEMALMLEDIVTHGRRTKRMTCECELGI